MNLNPFSWFGGGASETRGTSISDDDMLRILAGDATIGGSLVRVNQESALASIAVLACLQVRSETFSSLPGGVFRKVDRARLAVPEHRVAELLFDRPNAYMTAGELWRWKQVRQDSYGNADLRVIWRGGYPTELRPMYGQPSQPIVDKRSGRFLWRYNGDDLTAPGDYAPAEVLRFKGPIMKNPWEARSLIEVARDCIGLSIATEQFFGRFLSNGSHFPVYLETDTQLDDEDLKALKKQLGKGSGLFGAGMLRIFDRGLKVKQNAMSMKDADLTEQMRWYLEQICRVFRVPLPLVQDWTHGTYTNSEQAGLWFAQHTIAPIVVDTERAVRPLFVEGEDDLYVKWNLDALLRGDYTSRASGYSVLINCGVLSPNEARSFEDLDPYDGGDEHRVPLNTAPAEGEDEPTGAAADAAEDALEVETEDQGESPGAEAGPTRSLPIAGRDPAEGESAGPVGLRALTPIVENAIGVIRLRAIQDRERGRDGGATIEFARRVLAPIEESYRLIGEVLPVEQIIEEAISCEIVGA